MGGIMKVNAGKMKLIMLGPIAVGLVVIGTLSTWAWRGVGYFPHARAYRITDVGMNPVLEVLSVLRDGN
jgi:hypothetical protein